MIMSTTNRYDDALGLYADAPSTPRLGRLFSGLRTTWDAIGEGLAASRRYHELTSRGMSHEQAASKVFFEHFD
jgi:hypothetical protein